MPVGAISVSDTDPSYTTIKATVSLSGSGALTLEGDTGTTLSVTGSQAVANADLATLSYTPGGTRRVLLRSRPASPAIFAPWHDVAVERIIADQGEIAFDEASLHRGWWPAEASWRWTDGAGEIEVPADACKLSVRLRGAMHYPVAGQGDHTSAE